MASSVEQLTWAAGFFDGEGTVYIYSHSSSHRYRYLAISVSQRDPRPLLVFRELFGGSIHRHEHTRGVEADIWKWEVRNRLAGAALVQLLPYLLLKREQAELAIAYQDLLKQRKRNVGLSDSDVDVRRAIEDKIKFLNRKGREASVTELPCGVN